MKMKKTLVLLLAVGMCFGFAACEDDVASSSSPSSSPSSSSSGGGEHEHTYSTEWSKDETHHWYACTGEECTEVDKKAEHDWDGGEITTAATPTADGVKTFTCETCGKTKTEAVQYVPEAVDTEVTAEEWLAAFNKATSMDVAKTVRVYTGESAVEANLTYVYKITDTVTYEYNSADSGMERIVVMDGTTNAMYQRSGVNATSVLGGWMYSTSMEYIPTYFNIYKTAQADYMGAGTFANFTYDDATGAYSYTIPGPYSSTTQCKAYCVNGELRALYWYGARGMKGYQYYYVFDYAEPQMDIPVLTVTETEYANAYADWKDATVAKSISVDYGNGRTLYMTDGVSIFVGESDYELIYTKNGTNYYCYTRYYDDGEGAWGTWRVQTVTQLAYEQGYAMYYMSAMSFVQEPAYSALMPEVNGCYTWSDADYEYTYYFENGRFQAMYAEGISGSDRQLAVNYGVPEIEIPQNATPID
ncbi:MAG: hypothetical protein IJD33_01845 [Clostridia bacterium]|nr:hypothetical protein [Clostridia bacterium]